MSTSIYELTFTYGNEEANLTGTSKIPLDEAAKLIALTVGQVVTKVSEETFDAWAEDVWTAGIPGQAVFTANLEGEDTSLKIIPVDGDETFDMKAVLVRAVAFCNEHLDPDQGEDGAA